MADASYVQVAPDSSGKKIRNLQLEVLQADGTFATVQMQVITIADAEGRPISLIPDRELLRELRKELRLHTDILLRVLEAVNPDEHLTREEVVSELDEQDETEAEELGEER